MLEVPFFRPDVSEEEIAAVGETLRSGWLTSGPRVERFERAFAAAVGARHAVALSSCTAALHLAAVALGLRRGQAVLVPTMTFAASAEVLCYSGAIPILVDCDPETSNLCYDDAERKLADLRAGRLPPAIDPEAEVVGIIPVHVGGRMLGVAETLRFAARHGLWVAEDAAHAFPAAWRASPRRPWHRCGDDTAGVTCFSFYANKTITTGEGGMAVTADAHLAERIRTLALHGLSRDAWDRYSSRGAWDYRILAAGYKYNLTDVAAALGLGQLERAEAMRCRREAVANRYRERLADVDELALPPISDLHLHSWHLFQIRLHLDKLTIDRDTFLQELRRRGIGFSVHWRPLHLHPFYQESFGWTAEHLPIATEAWQRTISLPIFPTMRDEEVEAVVEAVRETCRGHRR